ncbi:hypothetical protein Pan216_31450 [Planctomycetes bacterium Pan216]|uniref:Glycine zipper domain-containing protein n=1 Tax=Kolteria novifilia TaxID=2527975 RepID=A0A518B5M2_9BACT|nr:hypothetical protein Pan216_31450 [Planctomycetes bacterium Pan216]
MAKVRGVLGAIVLASLVGCANFTEKGLAAGGLLGAGTGALIGSQTGDAGAGALIGGTVGALTGTLVGAGLDEVDEKNKARVAAATAAPPPPPMSVADVVSMSQNGVGEDVIISTIRSSGTIFHLSTDQIIALHHDGVSNRVLDAMVATKNRVAKPVPVVYERSPVYIVEPPVRYRWGYRHHHCWH